MVHIPSKDAPLERLDVWSGILHGVNNKDYTVLRGIEVKPQGGTPERAGYCPPPDKLGQRVLHETFYFPSNKKLDWMDVYSGDQPGACVDSLRFHVKDKDDYFAAGGASGPAIQTHILLNLVHT
ncbi:hypothetical protein EYZ11_012512 [Aspergillus tanneri]|uniref:Uncharacterized protein n=1 Tax=Aspergillus tanneri TaxID=1220188 RepID=A0A4S3J5G1_9EURO|nr:hypothetical protein EYZ11_012512 [Aspergillus tanneri]